MEKPKRTRVADADVLAAITEVKEGLGHVELSTEAIYDELMRVKATAERHDEGLAALKELMWRRLDAHDDRFDDMDKRLASMGKRLDARFDSMDRRFDQMGKRLDLRCDSLDVRFDRLDARFGVLKVRPARLSSSVFRTRYPRTSWPGRGRR